MIPLLLLLVPWQTAAPSVRSYELDVLLEPQEAALIGSAVLTLDPGSEVPRELVLHLHDALAVESVSRNGREIEVEQERVPFTMSYSLHATRARLRFEEPIRAGDTISVRWSGLFEPSRARSPSDYMRIDPEDVLLRAWGYSLWFPVLLEDGPASSRVAFRSVTLRTPAHLIPVFAGEWLGEHEEDGQLVSRWRASDLDLYDAQLTARTFVHEQQDGVHVYPLDRPGSLEVADAVLEFAREIRAFYVEHFRSAAATPQLHVMEMPAYGDIASGNVVGISSANWSTPHARSRSATTLAHELVHPFVAVPVGVQDPLYALVREGFPSYFHLLALDAKFGHGFYDRVLDRIEASYLRDLEATPGTGRSLPPEKPLVEITEAEIGTYKDVFLLSDRALLLLDHLRRRLGPNAFLAFARGLLERDSLGLEEFEAACLRATTAAGQPALEARDLQLWLHGTGYPSRLRRHP